MNTQSWDVVYDYIMRRWGSVYLASDTASEYGHLPRAEALAEARMRVSGLTGKFDRRWRAW